MLLQNPSSSCGVHRVGSGRDLGAPRSTARSHAQRGLQCQARARSSSSSKAEDWRSWEEAADAEGRARSQAGRRVRDEVTSTSQTPEAYLPLPEEPPMRARLPPLAGVSAGPNFSTLSLNPNLQRPARVPGLAPPAHVPPRDADPPPRARASDAENRMRVKLQKLDYASGMMENAAAFLAEFGDHMDPMWNGEDLPPDVWPGAQRPEDNDMPRKAPQTAWSSTSVPLRSIARDPSTADANPTAKARAKALGSLQKPYTGPPPSAAAREEKPMPKIDFVPQLVTQRGPKRAPKQGLGGDALRGWAADEDGPANPDARVRVGGPANPNAVGSAEAILSPVRPIGLPLGDGSEEEGPSAVNAKYKDASQAERAEWEREEAREAAEREERARAVAEEMISRGSLGRSLGAPRGAVAEEGRPGSRRGRGAKQVPEEPPQQRHTPPEVGSPALPPPRRFASEEIIRGPQARLAAKVAGVSELAEQIREARETDDVYAFRDQRAR